uniref:Uncharacterized protein n=1 Tax=Steinernema glaseri TaxID=37863 RepID=A0A1I7Z1B2_9BILA
MIAPAPSKEWNPWSRSSKMSPTAQQFNPTKLDLPMRRLIAVKIIPVNKSIAPSVGRTCAGFRTRRHQHQYRPTRLTETATQ